MGDDVLPLHVRVGDFFSPFYEGVYFSLAILIGVIIAGRIMRRGGLRDGEFHGVIFSGIIGAMIGGRLFHVLFYGSRIYWENPLRILAVWEGGVSVIGGIVGGLMAGLVACRMAKAPFERYFALASPALAIGQGIGRIGCFFNGDAFGLPTDLPWGMSLKRYGVELFSFRTNEALSSDAWTWCRDQGLVGADSLQSAVLHPTQLYEALFDFLLAGILVIMIRSGSRDRLICCVYAIGFSVFRFLVEYLHQERGGLVMWNTSAIQFFLLVVAIVSVAVGLREWRKGVAERRDARSSSVMAEASQRR